MTNKHKKTLARNIVHGFGLIVIFVVAWGAVYLYITDPLVLAAISGYIAFWLGIAVLVWALAHYD